MHIKEKITQVDSQLNSQLNSEKLTIERDLQLLIEKQESDAQSILDKLEIKNFFEEIKDDLYGCGEINIKKYTQPPYKNFPKYSQINITYTLNTPTWFELIYHPGEYEMNQGSDDYGHHWVKPYYSVLEKSRSLNVNISPDNKKEYDGNFRISCISRINQLPQDSKQNETNYGYFTASINKIHEMEEIKEKLQNWFLLNPCLQDQKINFYPVTEFITKCRKIIIEKLKSGELHINNIPNNFLSEEEKKLWIPSEPNFETKTQIIQKRSFLDKLLGKLRDY